MENVFIGIELTQLSLCLEGVIVFDYCHSTSFESNDKKIALILLYVSAGWVGGWTILTILVNMCYGFVYYCTFKSNSCWI